LKGKERTRREGGEHGEGDGWEGKGMGREDIEGRGLEVRREKEEQGEMTKSPDFKTWSKSI